MGDFMKKGLYLSFNLKTLSVAVFSAVLIASGIACVRYASLSVATANISRNKPAIIVDAGHGGIDAGTQSAAGLLEKDINLCVSIKLGNMLSLAGYDVIYTRESDSINYPDECVSIRQKKVWDIHRRMETMQAAPDAIFLSIHQNFFTESVYSGAQMFYSGNNPESKIIADSIQKAVVCNLQPDNDRQIKKSGTEIYLLYHAKNPAVMVECGFLSNEKEAQLLNDDSYQSKLALSIFQGLEQYLSGKKEI